MPRVLVLRDLDEQGVCPDAQPGFHDLLVGRGQTVSLHAVDPLAVEPHRQRVIRAETQLHVTVAVRFDPCHRVRRRIVARAVQLDEIHARVPNDMLVADLLPLHAALLRVVRGVGRRGPLRGKERRVGLLRRRRERADGDPARHARERNDVAVQQHITR